MTNDTGAEGMLFDGVAADFHDRFRAWIRLEPRCRSADFSQGLQARTADPLWMLARQWQTGEFQGEDTGSPIEVQLTHSTQSLDTVRLGESDETVALGNTPLEVIVEREGAPLDWRTRVQIGQQFEHFARAELDEGDALALIQKYREAYPLSFPQRAQLVNVDRATRRFLELMAGRVIDGGLLLLVINQLLVPGATAPEAERRVANRLEEWRRALGIEPVASWPEAWRAEQMSYSFEVNPPPGVQPADGQSGTASSIVTPPDTSLHVTAGATTGSSAVGATSQPTSAVPTAEGPEAVGLVPEVIGVVTLPKVHLVAPDYRNGDLDWYTFSLGSEIRGTWSQQPQTRPYPTRITVGGTSSRWWAFEDAATNFGKLEAGKPDLAKLLLMEFVLIHGDDWFSVPLSTPMPSLVRIDEFNVVNVFGDVTPLQPATEMVRKEIRDDNADPDDPLLRWQLFTLSPLDEHATPGIGGVRGKAASNAVLLALPGSGSREESPPVEEVRFLRDEGANMVWAVEAIAPNGLGQPVGGAAAQRERIGRKTEDRIANLEVMVAQAEAKLERMDPSDDGRAVIEAEVREMRDEIARLCGGPGASPPQAGTVPRYRLATTVPENWIPFIPANANVLLDRHKSSVLLRRALMLRNAADEDAESIPSMTKLLAVSGEPLLWLEEATVPRSGLRVQLTGQRTRGIDGKTYVWFGRKVSSGKGEGSSGLRFDSIQRVV